MQIVLCGWASSQKCEPKQAMNNRSRASLHTTAPYPSADQADQLSDASSRRQSGSGAPQTIKERQVTSNQSPHVSHLHLRNSLPEQRTESDPTVLLNSSHSFVSLAAVPPKATETCFWHFGMSLSAHKAGGCE